MHLAVLIRRLVDSSLHGERGQGMVEYALILVLIAVVVIAILIVLGNQVQNVFCNISGAIGS
jgi:pilus assembly protein Flp/PilA